MNGRRGTMNGRTWIGAAIGLAVGIAGAYLVMTYAGRDGMAPHAPSAARAPEADGRRVLFYRNPMNPEVTSPVPIKDSMGMDYIPVYADGAVSGDPGGTVRIDPVTMQNIGVRTARAERRTLAREVRTVGRVDFNEERVARLHPKTDGWIEALSVGSTGAPVSEDTILLALYSPQLVVTQEEYLLALENREKLAESPYPDIRSGAEELVVSTRGRLRLLDVPEHQITELELLRRIKKTLHIHSPFDGVVVNVGARQGEFVTPETELYTIADLSSVWVYVDVYESDLPWVRAGDHAVMTLAAVPGRTFEGLITYVYPYMEPTTRTAKVRLEFPNPNQVLKPAMFADITIHASRQVDAVVIPAEAVIRSGAREQVFVVRGPGKFEPRPVTLGVSAEGLTQVVNGLEPGEEVVTSAQFLIDSESKLKEATAKMMEVTPAVAPGAVPASAGTTPRGGGDAATGGHDMAAMPAPAAGAAENPHHHDMGAMPDHGTGADQ